MKAYKVMQFVFSVIGYLLSIILFFIKYPAIFRT